jgi:hypothetical protein
MGFVRTDVRGTGEPAGERERSGSVVSEGYEYPGPDEGTGEWAALNEPFGAVGEDVRALAERVGGLESSGGGSGVPVADRSANGFWPHGWYYGPDHDEPAEVAANVEPIVDALGAPRVVGNTVGKGQNGRSFLAGGYDPVVTRTRPTPETPWDHTWVHHPLVPDGDDEDPAPDTVHGADGADLIEQREAILGRAADGEFAAEYDLPLGFPECGLDRNRGHSAPGRDNPCFLRRFHDWTAEHNVHWQTYFEARWYDGAFLAGPDFPDALAAYGETFSTGASADWIARYRETIDFEDRPT